MKNCKVSRAVQCMKIYRALALVVFVAFHCDPACGISLPFTDDFENIAVGDYPDENGWQNLFSGVSAYISDAIAHSGNRSFRRESYSTWSRTDYLPFPQLPDFFSYEVSVYPDSTPGHSGAMVGFVEAFGNQGPVYNRFTITCLDGSVGEVEFSQGGVGWLRTDIGEFTVGDWVIVRADLNFNTLTANLWLNGVLMVSDFPILPKEFDDGVYGHVVLNKWGATQYNWSGGGTGVVYIDDVRLSGIVEASIDIDPDTLNLNSKGKWITCYIELSEGYDVEDIDVSTIKLNDKVPAESHPTGTGDCNNNGAPELMVKFDRSAVQQILQVGDEVEITVTGEQNDGTPFEGSDTIRVIDKGGRK